MKTQSPECEIIKFPPLEIQNNIFFYSFVHPTSTIIKNNVRIDDEDGVKRLNQHLIYIETNQPYSMSIIDDED